MSLRARLVAAFGAALASIDLDARVRRAVAPLDARAVRVVAVGKAAGRMIDAAASVLGPRMIAGLSIAPDGAPAPSRARIAHLVAGHPLPDARSVLAAHRARVFARAPGDALVALISGGASALLCEPAWMSLDEARELSRALLASGGTIHELNVIRRHVSRIKGGGLARAAAPKRVLTVIASDVIAGAPHDVGSGPTVCDPSRISHAARAWTRLFASPPPRFVETPKPWSPASRRISTRVVVEPRTLAEAVGRALPDFAVRFLLPQTAPLPDFDHEYRELATRLAPGEAIVRAAEPTVTIRGAAGKGGRSGHLAAMLAPHLPAGVAFMAGASDGADGASGAAGAAVDADFAALHGHARIRAALDAFDTAPLHDAAGTAIHLGPTGHNLADVHVLAREA